MEAIAYLIVLAEKLNVIEKPAVKSSGSID